MITEYMENPAESALSLISAAARRFDWMLRFIIEASPEITMQFENCKTGASRVMTMSVSEAERLARSPDLDAHLLECFNESV